MRITTTFHAAPVDRKHLQVMKLMDKLRQLADEAVHRIEDPDMIDDFEGSYDIVLTIAKQKKPAKKAK